MRTEFQRDRDRIVHSKAFRRLKHKTQVFIAPQDDHYVTRLSHTLEVSQIARTIARALNLNEDLTEAISLGHDLGHTPFGHVGEEVLNELYPLGFKHNEQSLRVVEVLEKDGVGLNLTWEVREGIAKHSKPREDILGKVADPPSTFEGRICRIADSVAYINHDIDDAIRAGLIGESDLPPGAIAVLGSSHSQRINTLVSDIIDQSWPVSGYDDSGKATAIAMSRRVLEAANALREFLFQKVYNVRAAGEEESREAMRLLYHYFKEHPAKMPQEYLGGNDMERRIVDYIAGMTDNYALKLAKEISTYSTV